jgi:hypothetical protein
MQAKNTLVILGRCLYYIALLTFVIFAALAAPGIYSVGFVAVVSVASLALGFDFQDSLADFSVGTVLSILKPSKSCAKCCILLELPFAISRAIQLCLTESWSEVIILSVPKISGGRRNENILSLLREDIPGQGRAFWKTRSLSGLP